MTDFSIDPVPQFDQANEAGQRRIVEIFQSIRQIVTDYETRIAALEAANVKVFSGTTDADSQTSFAHGLTSTDVLGFTAVIERSDGVVIGHSVGDGMFAAADSFRYYCNATNFYLDTVGSSLQSRPYRVAIFYV